MNTPDPATQSLIREIAEDPRRILEQLDADSVRLRAVVRQHLTGLIVLVELSNG